jgi:hypothetical protein
LQHVLPRRVRAPSHSNILPWWTKAWQGCLMKSKQLAQVAAGPSLLARRAKFENNRKIGVPYTFLLNEKLFF